MSNLRSRRALPNDYWTADTVEDYMRCKVILLLVLLVLLLVLLVLLLVLLVLLIVLLVLLLVLFHSCEIHSKEITAPVIAEPKVRFLKSRVNQANTTLAKL